MGNNQLKHFLKDFVASRVTMTDQDQQAKMANETVTKFIDCMKDVDPLFSELYQRIFYAGSFYEGLKIGEANQFDYHLLLNLPFKPEDFQVIDLSVPKGFVAYKLTKCCLERTLARLPKWPILKDMDKIMDPAHKYLSRTGLISWFQSVVARTLIHNKDTFSNITFACRGPGITLTIKRPINCREIFVDLVPVIPLNAFPASVTMPVELYTILNEIRCPQKPTCIMVPMRPPEHIMDQCEEVDRDKIFSVSIPEAEKRLMADKGCVKMLIKIFKAIRDNEGWTFLPSYYIKTVFLWQLVQNTKAEFWKEENLSQLFIMMLKEFIKVMAEKKLDHIFFEGYNLLQGRQQFIAAKTKFEQLLEQAESDDLKLQSLKEFVVSRVAMADQDKQAKVATETVNKFIDCMKEVDPLFNELYQRIFYAGSYYEGLNIGSANEFEYNLLLNLPFKTEDVQVVDLTVPKGFVAYKLTKCCLESTLARLPKWPILKDMDRIMDPAHKYLSRTGLRSWFQSIVARALVNNKDTFPNITFASRGPGITLTIKRPINCREIFVDLVPVIPLNAFPATVTMPAELITILKKVECPQKPPCIMVPMPPPEHIMDHCEEIYRDKIFIVSIPEAERCLMEDKGCVKMLIKIFKAIRDKEGWTFLPSYYIKTVFLWQLVQNPKTGFWKEDNLSQLFAMMLKEFIKAITEKKLDHIFFEGYNLLQGPQQFIATKTKFEKLLAQVESDILKLQVDKLIKILKTNRLS